MKILTSVGYGFSFSPAHSQVIVPTSEQRGQKYGEQTEPYLSPLKMLMAHQEKSIAVEILSPKNLRIARGPTGGWIETMIAAI